MGSARTSELRWSSTTLVASPSPGGGSPGGRLGVPGDQAERARAACAAKEAQPGSRGLRRRYSGPPALVQDTEVPPDRPLLAGVDYLLVDDRRHGVVTPK